MPENVEIEACKLTTAKKILNSLGSSRVHGQDGAQVRGAYVVGRSSHELTHKHPVGSLRGMECVPECKDVSIRAHVGQHGAKSDAVVWSLPATCNLRCDETCPT